MRDAIFNSNVALDLPRSWDEVSIVNTTVMPLGSGFSVWHPSP